MNSEINTLKSINHEESMAITGGAIGIAIGIVGLILTGAVALGYYDGKKDCIPPPCE